MSSFKVEFAFDSFPELEEFLSNLPGKKAPVVEKVSEKTPRVAKGPKPEPIVAEEKAPVAEPEPEKRAEPEVTYDFVAKATKDTVGNKNIGREKVIALLKTFGVETAKALKPEDWAAYVKGCGALMKAAKEEELA